MPQPGADRRRASKGEARIVTFLNRLTRGLAAFWPGSRLFQVRARRPLTGNRASRLSLLALRQNSEAVHGPDKLTHRNPHIQPAEPCSETSKRRKESINSPTNSCQCFCVMDAPEIYLSTGLVNAAYSSHSEVDLLAARRRSEIKQRCTAFLRTVSYAPTPIRWSLKKASRSELIWSALVVGMPCGKPG